MNNTVRRLFRELVDVPRLERERILSERPIAPEVRKEVESLLGFDTSGGAPLTGRVAGAVDEALSPHSEPSPATCGAYRLVQLLGTGGMGEVYLGQRHDGEIEQKVAIKLLRADTDGPVWRERFLRERQLLAYLNHNSIARLLDAGHTTDGRPYLVMEHVEGVRIDSYAAGLDLRAVLQLFLKVCDGVSHAHRHLIVHRDLKPSNILVDSAGQPKLLDFGIAKLLDTGDETRTVERMLTPNYASPEQIRGDAQTTATDIYSLGAVLHRLLTGRPPREVEAEEGIGPAQRIHLKHPRDVEHILRKALRAEPEERYASVDAFAADIRAFLDSRPVQARAGDQWYRLRKFTRRYRTAVLAASLAVSALVAGVQIANYQRKVAQQRFRQMRQLANKVLLLDPVVGGLHSSTRARHEVVSLSKQYLEALGDEARADSDLALEVGEAYSLLARTQGISVVSNLGQHRQAEDSLQKAGALVQPILQFHPNHRKALLTAARIHHDRMILAETEHRAPEAFAEAAKSQQYLDRLLETELTDTEREAAAEFYYNMALAHKNLNRVDLGISYARLAIETAGKLPEAHARMSLAWSLQADLLRITGELENALDAIREARRHLTQARFPSEMTRRSSWFAVLFREGRILGAGSGMSLQRTGEAIAVLEQAFQLVEEWTVNDREDAWSRLYLAPVGRELGQILRDRDPHRALVIYDQTLEHLAEVRDNTEARRNEVEILSGSAYALRRLQRVSEAKARLDRAFHIMSETGDYPAQRVAPNQTADAALRAMGDHYAETGETQRAAQIFHELLEKMTAANADPENDLRHAVAFSQAYTSLAGLERREAMLNARLALWRNWEKKLPHNTFVQRTAESARLSLRR